MQRWSGMVRTNCPMYLLMIPVTMRCTPTKQSVISCKTSISTQYMSLAVGINQDCPTATECNRTWVRPPPAFSGTHIVLRNRACNACNNALVRWLQMHQCRQHNTTHVWLRAADLAPPIGGTQLSTPHRWPDHMSCTRQSQCVEPAPVHRVPNWQQQTQLSGTEQAVLQSLYKDSKWDPSPREHKQRIPNNLCNRTQTTFSPVGLYEKYCE